MLLIRAVFVFLSIICSPMTFAADQAQSQATVAALASDVTGSGAVADAAASDTRYIRGFFGYLEFDLDPDAPDGVPGFGAISERTGTTAIFRSD